jgi:hypothetical protein
MINFTIGNHTNIKEIIILKKATTIGTKKVGIKDKIFMNMKE